MDSRPYDKLQSTDSMHMSSHTVFGSNVAVMTRLIGDMEHSPLHILLCPVNLMSKIR